MRLKERRVGTSASAITLPFLRQMGNFGVDGLIGCTSVLIISESGSWISHFCESPAIEGLDPVFEEMVIDPIENGDGHRMPSPFTFGVFGGILGPNTNPKILIFTPKNETTGNPPNEERIRLIERALTYPGKPFEGVQTRVWTYIKQVDSDSEKSLGKVLVQYSPIQVDDSESPPTEQDAIIRVWFEGRLILERRWVASYFQRVPDNPPVHSSGIPSHTVTSISDYTPNPRMRVPYDNELDIWRDLCQSHNTYEECKTAKRENGLLSGFEASRLLLYSSRAMEIDNVERSYSASRASTIFLGSFPIVTHSSRNSKDTFTAPSFSLLTAAPRARGWIPHTI